MLTESRLQMKREKKAARRREVRRGHLQARYDRWREMNPPVRRGECDPVAVLKTPIPAPPPKAERRGILAAVKAGIRSLFHRRTS